MEFVNKNKTTIPIAFKFLYDLDTFTTDKITKFKKKLIKKLRCYDISSNGDNGYPGDAMTLTL